MEGKVYDVVIIGSGPAGLTAAVYTTRGAASTLVIAGAKWGGQLMLTSTVDNYPGFPEGIDGPVLMEKMRAQAERFGAELVFEDAVGVDFSRRPYSVSTASKQFFSRSVIIATGAETVWLDVPGVSRYIGRGVSSCAPCDAPFFKNKRVAVVGGGDSAMEEALVLTKYASGVTIIHRRDQFRASQIMQDKVKQNSKIKILWNTEITEVKGESVVKSLDLINNQTKQTSQLEVDGLFVAIGHKPQSQIFEGKVNIDERGFIARNSDVKLKSQSSVPGVFVAGDIHDHIYKQAVTAAGFGCQAAMDALLFLDENKS